MLGKHDGGLVAVRSTLMKSGLQPLKLNGAGQGEICGRLVTLSSWVPQMMFAVRFQPSRVWLNAKR